MNKDVAVQRLYIIEMSLLSSNDLGMLWILSLTGIVLILWKKIGEFR